MELYWSHIESDLEKVRKNALLTIVPFFGDPIVVGVNLCVHWNEDDM